MADIELVIKIPTAIYEASQILDVKYEDTIQIPLEVIANGTPLPEKHGALKDIKQIGLTNFEIFMCNGDYKEALKMLIERIENAPTIIEAERVEYGTDGNAYRLTISNGKEFEQEPKTGH